MSNYKKESFTTLSISVMYLSFHLSFVILSVISTSLLYHVLLYHHVTLNAMQCYNYLVIVCT